MAVFEIDKEKIMVIFELKRTLKNTVNAVFEGRLTAAHLSSDVFAILEKLDALEIELIGEPIVQEAPAPPPPQEKQPAAPEVSAPVQPQEQPAAPEVSASTQPQEEQAPTQEAAPPAEEKAETPQSDQEKA